MRCIKLIVISSTLRQRDPIWRYYVSCSPTAPRYTYATRPAEPPCSSPQMQDLLIMSCSSNDQGPTFMRTRWRLRAYKPMDHQRPGRPLVYDATTQTIKTTRCFATSLNGRLLVTPLSYLVFSGHDHYFAGEVDWSGLRWPLLPQILQVRNLIK